MQEVLCKYQDIWIPIYNYLGDGMFSQTTEYALRVMVFLAGLNGTTATTRQIAAATRVPEGYLAKILQSLGRAGLIKAQRGLHGGSVLARDPAELTVLDVIDA